MLVPRVIQRAAAYTLPAVNTCFGGLFQCKAVHVAVLVCFSWLWGRGQLPINVPTCLTIACEFLFPAASAVHYCCTSSPGFHAALWHMFYTTSSTLTYIQHMGTVCVARMPAKLLIVQLLHGDSLLLASAATDVATLVFVPRTTRIVATLPLPVRSACDCGCETHARSVLLHAFAFNTEGFCVLHP